MTSTDLTQWYEGPRVGGFDYAIDPVVAPLGLDFQDTYRNYIAETPVLRHLGGVVVRHGRHPVHQRRPPLPRERCRWSADGGHAQLPDPARHRRRGAHPLQADPGPAVRPEEQGLPNRPARADDPRHRERADRPVHRQGRGRGLHRVLQQAAALALRRHIGLPREDVPFFQKFKDDVVRPVGDSIEETNAVIDAATTAMSKYLEREFDRRIAAGDLGDDLIGGLLEAVESGENLTRADMLSIVKLLVVAGLVTVVASLSCFLMFLARNPEHRHQLVEDPALSARAVEELLRHQTPVQQGWRKAIEHVTLPSGEEIKAGELIQAIWASANVDDAHFSDSAHVDFTRFPNRHIAYASGVHRCLGSHLARLELRVALEEWHKRIPEYSVDDTQIQMVKPRRPDHVPPASPDQSRRS